MEVERVHGVVELASAERTWREGSLKSREVVSGGSEKVVFVRPLLKPDGTPVLSSKNKPVELEAIPYVKQGSSVVMATFGRK